MYLRTLTGLFFVPFLPFGTSEQKKAAPVPLHSLSEQRNGNGTFSYISYGSYLPVPLVPLITYKNEKEKK